MSKSYPFPTYSGLLEPKHYKRIGSAIWLFLWFISSTTKEVEREGVAWGIVLGNKPLKLSELADQFDVNQKTIQRWIEALEQHGYIRVTRAPYGLIFTVNNSKKFNGERVDKNVQSNESDKTKSSTLTPDDKTEMSYHSDKNVHSNKDITGDITKNNTTTDTTNADFQKLFDSFCSLHQKLDIHVKSKDVVLMQEMIGLGVPVPLIIQVMEQVHKDRIANGANITTFAYYKSAILEAWETSKSITEAVAQGVPIPQTGSVALGPPKRQYRKQQGFSGKPKIPVSKPDHSTAPTPEEIEEMLALARKLDEKFA